MELSITERVILSNQFLILEKLDPDQAETYAANHKALKGGYSLHYEWMIDGFEKELSADECEEVLEIMRMYSILKLSFDQLEDKNEINKERITFQGFDQNNERRRMFYVRYILRDLGRYEELNNRGDFNSHLPMLRKYKRMLAAWNDINNKHRLTKEEMILITA